MIFFGSPKNLNDSRYLAKGDHYKGDHCLPSEKSNDYSHLAQRRSRGSCKGGLLPPAHHGNAAHGAHGLGLTGTYAKFCTSCVLNRRLHPSASR
jgi:hypothetical protein